MKLRLALIAAFIAALLTPVSAQPSSGLAPADEYFGRFQMSVLGIANTIHDAGWRIDEGSDPQALIGGPLAFATDAIVAWERAYPRDPWIASDLTELAHVYLRIKTPAAAALASKTGVWLARDYPAGVVARAPEIAPLVQAQEPVDWASTRPEDTPASGPMTALMPYSGAPVLDDAPPQPQKPAIVAVSPWERFAAMRAPLPIRH